VHNAGDSYRVQALKNTANGIRGIGLVDYLDPLTGTWSIGKLADMAGDHMLPRAAIKAAIAKFRDAGGTLSYNKMRQIALIQNGTDNLHLMPSSFNSSKGARPIKQWLGLETVITKVVDTNYARYVASQQEYIARQIDAILGGSFVSRKFFGQVL
jgi:hypothetical protein